MCACNLNDGAVSSAWNDVRVQPFAATRGSSGAGEWGLPPPRHQTARPSLAWPGVRHTRPPSVAPANGRAVRPDTNRAFRVGAREGGPCRTRSLRAGREHPSLSRPGASESSIRVTPADARRASAGAAGAFQAAPIRPAQTLSGSTGPSTYRPCPPEKLDGAVRTETGVARQPVSVLKP